MNRRWSEASLKFSFAAEIQDVAYLDSCYRKVVDELRCMTLGNRRYRLDFQYDSIIYHYVCHKVAYIQKPFVHYS